VARILPLLTEGPNSGDSNSLLIANITQTCCSDGAFLVYLSIHSSLLRAEVYGHIGKDGHSPETHLFNVGCGTVCYVVQLLVNAERIMPRDLGVLGGDGISIQSLGDHDKRSTARKKGFDTGSIIVQMY
jgi:hypothetical protein